MVQIWFGNTYLSFAQASSFHPLFGPILMTVFAALSNTLLLTSMTFLSWLGMELNIIRTVLISILSNTFATIDAVSTFLPPNIRTHCSAECNAGGIHLLFLSYRRSQSCSISSNLRSPPLKGEYEIRSPSDVAHCATELNPTPSFHTNRLSTS